MKHNNKISFVAVLVKPTDKELEKIKDLKQDVQHTIYNA